MSDARSRIAGMLAGDPMAFHARSEKDTRPYEQTYERGGLIPLGINGYTGKAEAAMPGLLHSIARLSNRAIQTCSTTHGMRVIPPQS